jgi:hypothetical protein
MHTLRNTTPEKAVSGSMKGHKKSQRGNASSLAVIG